MGEELFPKSSYIVRINTKMYTINYGVVVNSIVPTFG